MSGNKINKDEDGGNKMSEFDKKVMNFVYPYLFKTFMLFLAIKNKENFGDLLKQIEAEKFGLRTGSIIGNPLYCPGDDGDIEFISSSAGSWNIHDFRMPIITSSGCLSHTVTNTNLFYFPIEEIIGNHPDKFTPAGLLDMTSRFDQLMSFTKFNVDKALEIGIIRETTYGKVYKDYPETLREISDYSATDYSVLQVTPKGNTLIFPFDIGGKKNPPLQEGKKSFGLLPGVS